jgi:hypothetical protein
VQAQSSTQRTPLTYISESESDSKLYINFEFCEGKKLFFKHIHLQSQVVYVDINNFENNIHILGYGASSMQVD